MSTRGPGFWGYRWEGYSHEELYDLVNGDVRGASAVAGASAAWSEFVALMAEAGARTDRLLREAGVEWEGVAGESMTSTVSPLAAWAADAAAAGRASDQSLQEVASAFARTAHAMPAPVVLPSGVATTEFGRLVAGQHDEDAAGRMAQQARLRAVELMNGYASSNRDAAAAAGRFDEPARIGVSTQVGEQTGGGHDDHLDVPQPDDRESPRQEEGSGSPSGGSGDGAGSRGPGAGGPAPAPDVVGPDGSGPAPSQSGGSPTTAPAGAESRVGDAAASTSRGPAPRGGDLVMGPGAATTGRPEVRVPAGRGPGVRGPEVRRGPVAPGLTPGRGADPVRQPGRDPVAGRVAPHVAEGVPGRTAGTAGSRGGVGPGVVPGAAARRDDDDEHHSPGYLRDYHDDFWDDSPPVAPAVIGEDDD